MPLLRAHQLNVSLGEAHVLHDVTFSVEPGTFVGLVGPNGSGKTTLLRTVSGLLPFEGELVLAGTGVSEWKPRALAQHMAFVRQHVGLSFDFTVRDLVRLGRTPHKGWLDAFDEGDDARVRSALAAVRLDGFEERSVTALSGGEMQRAFLAQALVQDAALLLLDEPTAHLDVHFQFELVSDLARRVHEGATVIGVFHDLAMAARFAGHLLVMDGGRIVADGPPGEVLTPALIAHVFRMEARLVEDAGGFRHIHYERSLPPA